MTERDREQRAFEALIVWAMRGSADEFPDVENLPELNEKERAAMDSLGAWEEFKQRLGL